MTEIYIKDSYDAYTPEIDKWALNYTICYVAANKPTNAPMVCRARQPPK